MIIWEAFKKVIRKNIFFGYNILNQFIDSAIHQIFINDIICEIEMCIYIFCTIPVHAISLLQN